MVLDARSCKYDGYSTIYGIESLAQEGAMADATASRTVTSSYMRYAIRMDK
jgi:hypothetical protein